MRYQTSLNKRSINTNQMPCLAAGIPAVHLNRSAHPVGL